MRRRPKSSATIDNGSNDLRSDARHRTKRERSEDNETVDEIEPLATDLQITVATSVVVLALYAITLHPSVPGGDSGELIVSANELGVAHPPGYPLFTMLAKLAMTLIPVRSPAWRVNMLNAVLSSVASGFLQHSVLKLTGCVGSSLMAVGLFTLCKLTWMWSISAEVFGLNNLFAAILVCRAVDFDKTFSAQELPRKYFVLAVICGLALCNQHTIVIYVAAIALWATVQLYHKTQGSCLSVILRGALCGLLGLSPYLYLPVSSYLNIARWTWGDQRSLAGFLTHLLRREYGTFDLGKDQPGSGFTVYITTYFDHVQNNMCQLGPWLALIGLVTAISWAAMGRGSSLLVFAVMTSTYTFFFAWRANLDLSNPLFYGVVERFWMQSDIGVALLAAVGYHTAVRMVTEKFLGLAKVSMSAVFTTMGAGILIALQLKNNYSLCNQSSNVVVHNFAQTILDHFPSNAIVLTKGDLPTNSLRYLHLCEHIRRDLQLVDVEVLTYEWSLPMLRKFYPRVEFPGDLWRLNNELLVDGRRSFNFKTFLDANYKRYPLYVCIGMQERDASWQSSYVLWPAGVCHRVMSVNEHLDTHSWANVTGGFADKWTYPSGTFDSKSWERVANDEMWHAKISTAFYFYKQAELTPDENVKSQFLIASYELYFRAIKLNQKPSRMNHVETFPSFWHKNFALVCERLLHVDTGVLDKIRLCKLSIYHFQQYIHLTPDDSDHSNIQNAINILQQRLDTYDKLNRVDRTLEKAVKRTEKLEEINKQVEAAKLKHRTN